LGRGERRGEVGQGRRQEGSVLNRSKSVYDKHCHTSF
jgi:hypothetical protein